MHHYWAASFDEQICYSGSSSLYFVCNLLMLCTLLKYDNDDDDDFNKLAQLAQCRCHMF